jgi:hypothetical protein
MSRTAMLVANILASLLLTVTVILMCAMGIWAINGHHGPTEDDPGWDCRTMGNHQCGPATP